ncbi:MAG: hypothetical protein M1833_005333 [Piccolia ochrophora]|nr:MAG: hypothetical protein M1833_005333 [Piccolia ochrophora]
MGSAASRASRNARSTARQYPSRTPPSTTSNARPPPSSTASPGPTVHPKPHASGTRDEAINLDASDPQYAASLRELGAVTPSPTLSHSSTFSASAATHPSSSSSSSGPGAGQASNAPPPGPDPSMNPAITLLRARDRLAAEADVESREVGRRGHPGRQFLDVVALRQVLTLRDREGVDGREIERRMGLRSGVVKRLGGRGVVGAVG